MAEFLPLCDVLFNVLSLAGYFCDVVFDVVMGYALLERGYKGTFAAAISIVITSLLITQVLSIRWYLSVWFESEERKGRPPWLPIVLHCLQLGVLWRYARLLVPLELRRVKHQVRDLCMLRLVHAFCEAAPMLLLQLHILLRDTEQQPRDEINTLPEPSVDEPAANKAFAELNVISASLSLFSVCWALASFSKNVRLRNVHRLVLTWLGLIFQFLWRLGTVAARVCALTVYGLVYEYWLFLVIGLHWLSMFLWVISPRGSADSGAGAASGSSAGRARLSALTAAVLVLAYVNLHDCSHTQRMVIFYCVMCIENGLLVTLWWMSGRARRAATLAVAAPPAFIAGILFMLLYYRYFHVRRLGYMLGDNQQGTNSTNASSQSKNGKQSNQADNAAIPGVFNCRFTNPVNSAANGRKKKKPTSFVPPPAAPAPPAPSAAFWRRPQPAVHNHHSVQGGSSENEGSSVGSRVNIQQKLQEKKLKQLAELRVIEEEIKQGKLAKTTPVAAEEIYSSLQRQPIPRAKTHAEPAAWPTMDITHSYQNYPILPHNCTIYTTYTEIKPEFAFQNENQPADLKMRCYDNSRTFYENPANLRSDVTRSPIRSPNYLETRTYDTSNCATPRNVLNSSPGNLNNYEPNVEKPRVQNGIYSEGHVREYSGYCENNQYKYRDKDEYSSPLQHIGVQPIDNMRTTYNEPCNQYNQNCERFEYLCGTKGAALRALGRCRTPEILLAPHYLRPAGAPACCHATAPAPAAEWQQPLSGRKKEEGGSSGGESSPDVARDTPRPPSDIDSQISLPRSYTLPREFRYWRRRPRLRDAHVPSNNSSDGDVDSGDDNESDRRSNCSAGSQLQSTPYTEYYPRPDMLPRQEPSYDCERRRRAPRKQGVKPETKL